MTSSFQSSCVPGGLSERCVLSAGGEVMEEVERTAAGGAHLLMECDEEEQEVWPQSPERDEEEEEEEEEGRDEGEFKQTCWIRPCD